MVNQKKSQVIERSESVVVTMVTVYRLVAMHDEMTSSPCSSDDQCHLLIVTPLFGKLVYASIQRWILWREMEGVEGVEEKKNWRHLENGRGERAWGGWVFNTLSGGQPPRQHGIFPTSTGSMRIYVPNRSYPSRPLALGYDFIDH